MPEDPIEATATPVEDPPAEPEAEEQAPEPAPLPEPEAPEPEPDAEPIAAELIPARPGAVGSALADLPVIPQASEATQIAQLAVTLAAAGACPAAIRGKPNDVFLVLLSARDLGVSLTTAMREFHVIEGKVTLSPKVKLALVRQSGLGKIWPDSDNGPLGATWHAERHDLPGQVISSTFTWADAQLAHLVDSRCTPHEHWRGERGTGRNSAECFCKTNWKTYPARMLSWRAAGYLLDDVFPEVGTGLYSPDELGAVTDAEGEPIEVKASEPLPGMRGAGSSRGAAAAEEPERISPDGARELRARTEAAKAHPDARQDLSAWWAEREFPKIEELTTGQAKILEAKLAQLASRFELEKPEPAGAAQADAQQASPPDEPAAEPPAAPEGAEAPIPPAQDRHLAAGGSFAGGPADGDVAGWLIEQASAMNAAKIRAAYKAAEPDPPAGNVEALRLGWARWRFEAMARGLCWILSGCSIDPAAIGLPEGDG